MQGKAGVKPCRRSLDPGPLHNMIEPRSALTDAPVPVLVPGGVPSDTFAVSAVPLPSRSSAASTVATKMPCYAEHDYHVAHFTATSAVEIAVSLSNQGVADCAVRPRRLALRAREGEGGTAVFEIPAPSTRPFYLMVECSGVDDKLLVLVDAPMPVPATPPGAARVSVLDFHADPSGVKDSTAAIQHALDVPKTTLVLVPAGHFMTTDTLVVRSNTTLFLQAGAVIRSTSNRSRLPKPRGSCAGNLVSMMSLAPGAQNVAITGLGRLDANGFQLMQRDVTGNCSAAKGWLHRRRVLDSASGGTAHRDIAISGIVLADSTTWTLAIEDVDNMVVNRVKVLNHKNVTQAKIENDGLDLISTRDAVVSWNFVITVDDAMCAKASSTAVRNVTFSDNVVFSSCGGNKAGMQANAPFGDVRFVRTDVLHARRGIIVQSTTGDHTMRGVEFRDVVVENLFVSDGHTPITPVAILADSSSISNVSVVGCILPRAPAGPRDGV